MELLAMHTQCKHVVKTEKSYIMRTYEIYFTHDFTNTETKIECIDVDTKKNYKIILPYIQRDKNVIYDAAISLIKTNAIQ